MQTDQNATPSAGKQSSDVQIRQNSRHAREKKSNGVQTGHEAKSSTGKQYHGVLEGENVQEIPSVAGQTTGAKYFRQKNPDKREKLRKLNPSRINLCLGLI